MRADTARLVASNSLKKGDVLAVARYAGVQAAKDSFRHLPLLEPLLSPSVQVDFSLGEDFIDISVPVEGEGDDASSWMPALTAVTVASLTIFDMCKAVDRTMVIGPVRRETE
jgi:cyclic pyranopterin monophosphate synthase